MLTNDRPLTNRERRAQWSTRYLLSGHDLIAGDIGKHLQRHMEAMFQADGRDALIEEQGYEHDCY